MPTDELFLENIDELINDENKVDFPVATSWLKWLEMVCQQQDFLDCQEVTYKSLSCTLKVHSNVAKQMLYAYLDKERQDKGKTALSATYFISGLTKPAEDASQVFKCVVTNEDKLEEWKKSFAVVTSCHLYSIQKNKLKDTNPLYMSDYEKFKENVFDCNKYSSIQYDKATPRSAEDMDLLMVNVPDTESEKKPVSSTTGQTKAQTKKGQQAAIANMFAKVDKKPSGKQEKEVKQEVEKKGADKAAGKGAKKGGMMGFLAKQSDSKPTKQEEKKKTPEKKKSPEKKVSPVSKKKEPSPADSKKNQRKEDSDDEDIFRSKKRRRTQQDIFESSSEGEEEMETEPEPESPVPSKEKSPEPVVVEEEEVEDPAPKLPSPAKESGAREVTKGAREVTTTGGQKRRVRKRKLVPKTYQDKDGFIVTEKVWESDSTDASEAEEPIKKPAPKQTSPDKGKKGSPKKKISPGKKGQPASGKQTSLMSFFKKS